MSAAPSLIDALPARERDWNTPFGPHLSRPTGEQLTGRRFSGEVSLMLTKATSNDIPAAGLRKVRRRLAAERGFLVTERQIWVLNHRSWAVHGVALGTRPAVPTFAEAMDRAASDFHVILAESDRKL